jgi:transposase
MSENSATCEPRFTAFVAIDWADRQHAFALEDAATGRRQTGSIEHTPEAVASWVAALLERFGGGPIALALEQSRGALLAMLTHYEQLVIYPVNPVTVAGLRQAFFPSGAKDDPPDAALLLDLLTRHRDRLRPLEPDTVELRTLRWLVEQRRQFVNEKTRQKNRLTAQLKLYFPQVLEWFDEIDTQLVEELLRRWPTLEALQRARPATVLRLLERHHSRSRERNQQRLGAIRQARPATRDGAVVAASTAAVKILLGLIRELREGIAELDQQIGQITASQEDFAVFDSFPAAGPALAPRLLAAFGTRRERYAEAAEVASYSGIAPVVVRSGRRQTTHFRWAAPKFLRQSFHEFAAFSTRKSVWARAYYEQQRAKGKTHHQAVRALAFKWIRILFRCWQDGTPYDEGRYLQALARRGSPLVAALPSAADAR